jgi:hypothetical protein
MSGRHAIVVTATSSVLSLNGLAIVLLGVLPGPLLAACLTAIKVTLHLMDTSTAGWLVIAIAIAAANLPFFNDKLFALCRPLAGKPLFVRLLEMTALFLSVGALASLLKANIGNRFPQLGVLRDLRLPVPRAGFPGFIVRYLRKATADTLSFFNDVEQ